MRSTVREVFETIVLTVLIFLLVRAVVQNFKVEGHSMEPTLFDGQYLLINKAIYWEVDLSPLARFFPQAVNAEQPKVVLFREPERGDIVVFRAPQSPDRDYIKRVIGVPGDRVEVKGDKVYVNGTALSEPYIVDAPQYDYPPTTVPPDSYFVLGDHRNNSSDSHVWGMVPRDNMVGVAWVSYWPPAQWGLLTGLTLPAGGS
ncbi:MAG: signal peptidase I [Chloroflexi bacterium]|nr:signal peptidase I [Chloroflexota bacterium]MCL5110653.1 signal peptidase I [Chloroflexota bacterium]